MSEPKPHNDDPLLQVYARLIQLAEAARRNLPQVVTSEVTPDHPMEPAGGEQSQENDDSDKRSEQP